MGRLLAVLLTVLALSTPVAGASRRASQSWASPQIAAVVEAGLMGASVADFRPEDPLTWSELATVVASLGGTIAVTDPYRTVTLRELDARLVSVAGLRQAGRDVRAAALAAGLTPTPWLGTETVARMLGLRVNHERAHETRELQLTQAATRAEAAYSVARLLRLTPTDFDAVEAAVADLQLPSLSDVQRQILDRALRLVGSPYVWAGTSEKPQKLFGKLMPGGFDCSGLVWRVYKLEPLTGAAGVGTVLRGRTSYAMSGEVPASSRIPREVLAPGDVVFFGSRGVRSKPSEVGHMGIYVGDGWIVHSSRYGTTLTPLTGWYETSFAWARRPLAEAGLASAAQATGGGREPEVTA